LFRKRPADWRGMNNPKGRGAQRWQPIISAQLTSGLSIAAYCRREQISQPSFFAWRRRLAGPAAGFVEVETLLPTAGETLRAPAIELRLGGGRRLVVRKGFDRDLLAEVVQALEAIP
jgi:hypothetical protein